MFVCNNCPQYILTYFRKTSFVAAFDYDHNHELTDFVEVNKQIVQQKTRMGYLVHQVNGTVMNHPTDCLWLNAYCVQCFTNALQDSKRFRRCVGGYLRQWRRDTSLTHCERRGYSLVILAVFHSNDWIDSKW